MQTERILWVPFYLLVYRRARYSDLYSFVYKNINNPSYFIKNLFETELAEIYYFMVFKGDRKKFSTKLKLNCLKFRTNDLLQAAIKTESVKRTMPYVDKQVDVKIILNDETHWFNGLTLALMQNCYDIRLPILGESLLRQHNYAVKKINNLIDIETARFIIQLCP